MKRKKSQYIASTLKLKDEEFNNLIDCPLTGPRYYDLLRNLSDQRFGTPDSGR